DVGTTDDGHHRQVASGLGEEVVPVVPVEQRQILLIQVIGVQPGAQGVLDGGVLGLRPRRRRGRGLGRARTGPAVAPSASGASASAASASAASTRARIATTTSSMPSPVVSMVATPSAAVWNWETVASSRSRRST